MSFGLAAFAISLVLFVGAAVVYAFWDLVEEWREKRRDAREAAHAERAFQAFDPPATRPAVPATDGWRPIRVGQTDTAEAADPYRLTRNERDLFDAAVGAYRNLPAAEPLTAEEQG